MIYASRTVATWQATSTGKFVPQSHNILNTWETFFYQLLNVGRAIYAWQAAMHAAESFMPDLHSFETETDINTEGG